MRSNHLRQRLFRAISILLCLTLLIQASPIAAGPQARRADRPPAAATRQPGQAVSSLALPALPLPRPAPRPALDAETPLAQSTPAAPPGTLYLPLIVRGPAQAAGESLPPLPPGLTLAQMSGAPRPAGPAGSVPLAAGWNLASLPEIPADTAPAAVLASIAGQYNLVYTYNACDAADPWKLYDPANPAGSDLAAMDHKIGFWVDMKAAAVLTVDGTPPTNTVIPLCIGWNLIGYPLARAQAVPQALASIAGQYTMVYTWDPADPDDPWAVYDVAVPAWANDLQIMEPGWGYWVYATANTTLTIAEPTPTPTATPTPTVTPTPTPTRVPVGQPPTAAITSPGEGAEVTDFVDIIGTASDPDGDLAGYRLQYRQMGAAEWTTFVASAAPVVNDVLGRLDPTLLPNGMYEVRLVSTDSEGQQTAAPVLRLVISGQHKIGHFTLTFTDVTLPLSGLDVTVLRTYDSRDKQVGDFGVGWTLSLTNLQLAENRIAGKDWEQTKSGGFVPTYCIEPTQLHLVTVTFPDGKVYRFTPTISPSCQSLIPLQYVTVSYVALPGTTARLEPPVGGDVIVFGSPNGPVELRDLDLNLYNPTGYRLTLREGTVFVIDKQTGVQRITDPNGNSLSFSPTTITHSTGKGVAFQRDGLGRVTRITDPLGQSLRYAYDARGDLVSMTDRRGNVTTFSYDDNHRLQEIFDPLGRRPARNEYDADGRLIAVEDADGQRATINHDLAGRTETVTDRLGNQTTVAYDAQGNILAVTDPLGHTTRHTYDANGNRLTTTDPYGNVTAWTYNAQGDVLSTTDPLGHTTTFTYDAAGRLLTQTDPLGRRVVNGYDSKGNLLTVTDPLGNSTRYAYDARGNLTGKTDPLGRTTGYGYDANGFLSGVTDPAGNRLTIQYDELGRPTGQSFTRTTAAGVETLTTQTRYDANGNVTAFTDAQGRTSTHEYNAANRPTLSTDAEGRTMRWAYDDLDRPTREEQPGGVFGTAAYDAEGRMTGRTDHLGRTSGFSYDPLGRLTGVQTHDGVALTSQVDALGRPAENASLDGALYSFTYDPAGRLVSLNSRSAAAAAEIADMTYTYDDAGQMIAQQDALGGTVTYTRDANGRVIATTFDDGSAVQQTYDAAGQVIATTDQAGRVTRFGYDAAGRLTAVTDAAGGVTTYAYDELGNLASMTDASGHTTRYAYDADGLLVSRTLPLGMAERWTYDDGGRLTSYAGFNGPTTLVEHDVRNRPVKKVYPDGATAIFTYTAYGNVARVDSAEGVITYEYDANNLLRKVTYPWGGWVAYTHDAEGKPLTMSTAAGVTRYTYDGYGRLATVADPDGKVTTYSYDLAGNRTAIAQPNGTVTRYTYNNLGLLTQVVNYRPDNSVSSSYSYTLDVTGRRTRVEEFDGINTRTVDYVYDDLYRLTAEQVADPVAGAYTLRYTYDAVGNRLTKTGPDGTTTCGYDANDRLLTETLPDGKVVRYDYDAAGNLTKVVRDGVTTSYRYDSRGRLVGVTDGAGATTTYTYDHNGVRLSRRDAGGTVYYLTDIGEGSVLSRVLLETDAGGAVLARYTYGDDLAPLSLARGADRYYYHSDGHRSTRALTDGAGAVTDRYVYDAWGNLLGHSGSTANDFLYNGQQYDANSGYYFLRARYYDPQTGRFVSRDLMRGLFRDPQELNPYLYARGDPVNLADPTGYFSIADTLAAQVVIGVLASMLFTAFCHYQVGSYMPETPFIALPQAALFQFNVSLMFSKWKSAMRVLPILALVSVDLSLQVLYYFAGFTHRAYFFYSWGLSVGSDKIDPGASSTGFVGGLVYDIHRGVDRDEPAPTDAKTEERYLQNNYPGAAYSAYGAVPNIKVVGQPTLFASVCDSPSCTYGFTVAVPPNPGAFAIGGGYSVTTGPILHFELGDFQWHVGQDMPVYGDLMRVFAKVDELRARPRPLPNRTLRPIDAYFYSIP